MPAAFLFRRRAILLRFSSFIFVPSWRRTVRCVRVVRIHPSALSAVGGAASSGPSVVRRSPAVPSLCRTVPLWCRPRAVCRPSVTPYRLRCRYSAIEDSSAVQSPDSTYRSISARLWTDRPTRSLARTGRQAGADGLAGRAVGYAGGRSAPRKRASGRAGGPSVG